MSYTNEERDEIIELIREKNISDYAAGFAFTWNKGYKEGYQRAIEESPKKVFLKMSI